MSNNGSATPELPDWRPAALAWLNEERFYQDRKFGEAVCRAALARGVRTSDFGRAIGQYGLQSALFQREGAWQQMVQRAAKLTATCKAVCMTAHLVHNRTKTLAEAWDHSQELARILSSLPLKGIYLPADSGKDLWNTPLGEWAKSVDSNLERGEIGLAAVASIGLLHHGLQFLGDKLSVQNAECGHVNLPRPGLSAGNIEPWQPFPTDQV